MNKFALGLAVIGAITASIGFYNIAKQSMSPNTVIYEQKVLDNWTAYKIINLKSYSSEHESNYRLAVFNENLKKIDEINSNPKNTFKAGLNEFSDLTAEEFGATFTGLNKDLQEEDPSIETLESSPDLTFKGIDWTTLGGVTPPKRQGECGACWAFAAIGCLENLDFIQNKQLRNFSEQQLVDCDKGSYIPPTPGNQGCLGGGSPKALKYTSWNGVTYERTYPYTFKQGTCKYNKSMSLFKNNSYRKIKRYSLNSLKAALDVGVVAISIDGDCLQHYQYGIYNIDCLENLNHEVLAVGYGDGFFKLKNSWGTGWGEKGYFRLGVASGQGIIGMLSDMTQAI